MADKLELGLEISAEGAGKTAKEILEINKAVAEAAKAALATAKAEEQAARISAEAAREKAKALQEAAIAAKDAARDAANAIGGASDKNAARDAARQAKIESDLAARAARDATKAAKDLGDTSAAASKKAENAQQQATAAVKKFTEAQKTAADEKGGIGAAAAGFAEIAFRINNIIGLLQTLRATAAPAYDALIGSNERLKAQLLSSQTNLASSSRIFTGGQEVTDPTAKIEASQGKLRAALKQIEVDTQSLVGVTSSQVNELFQITLTNAAQLNQQSKEFPDAISAATSLTKGWAASLKVVGVPLFQARQEINSILKGQIDQNSTLAKNLQITNGQVETWRAQGRLVDELNKRLTTFVAGNAIAARSIEGISSNIQDLGERIGRVSGEPLLEPIIERLAQVEKYLKDNEAGITAFFRGFTDGGARAIDELDRFKPTFDFLEKAISDLSVIAGTLFSALVDGSIVTAQILQNILEPLLITIGKAIEGYAKLAELINERRAADRNEALAAFNDQVLAQITAVGTLSSEIKKLSDIRKSGGTLTEQQLAREKQLTASAQIQGQAIADQIKALKALGELTGQQSANRDGQIKTLEAQAKKLQDVTGGFRLEAKEIETLGTTTEQFTKKLENAQRQIRTEGQGDPAVFKAAAADILKLAKSGVEARQLTVGAAREQLEAIRNNTKVELETQTAAKLAIDQLYDGRIAKIKELIDVSSLAAGAGLDELAQIRDDSGLQLSTRRKAAQQIVTIRREQIGAETAEITAGTARIAALQASQRLSEAKADQESTKLKLAELRKRQEASQVALENATGATERQRITAEIAQQNAEVEKLQAEAADRQRKRDVEKFDQLRNLTKAQRDLGKIDQEQANREILRIDQQQLETQIKQQTTALNKLSENDNQGRAVILSKIAELESKKIAVQRQFFDDSIKLLNARYEQESGAINLAYKQRLIGENEFNLLRARNIQQQAEAEIIATRDRISRLGAADIQGRNALQARINELLIKRIEANDAYYQSELEQIKRFQQLANQAISEAENQRAQLVQIAANRQLSSLENIERQKLTNQRQSLADQLAAAQEQEAKLALLAKVTRSPEQERAYQAEVRAARLATAQITLKLLEQEGQQIQFARTQAIKSIEDQQAARDRSINAQLGNIAAVQAAQNRATRTAEANAQKESQSIDSISKALERQNNLFTARANLAKALQGAADTQGTIEADRVKTAIELTKQLQEGNISERERLVIQQQLTALTGSNTKTIADLTREQQRIETEAASRKQAALLFEQEQARLQLTLDQRRNDLANQRALIEARIAEIKAKAAIVDAQQALQQERLNSQRSITAAQAELDRARQQAPGQGRDRAVADAQARLQLAQQQAQTNQANAQQSITLAQQGLELAKQNTAAVAAQITGQTEINRLQSETLIIQQRAAIAQANAVEQARQYANELERAKLAATGINLPGSGNLAPLQLPNLGSFPTTTSQNTGEGVIRAVQQLQQSIERREPKFIQEIKFESGTNDDQLNEFYKSQRAVARAVI
jgi:hypothetical protein